MAQLRSREGALLQTATKKPADWRASCYRFGSPGFCKLFVLLGSALFL